MAAEQSRNMKKLPGDLNLGKSAAYPSTFPTNRSKILPLLIQVCESLSDPKTLKREVTALSETMRELGKNTGIIVTLQEEQNIEIAEGIISVVPAWKFLLYLEAFIDAN